MSNTQYPHFLGDSTNISAIVHEIMIELKSRSIYNDCDNLVTQELINETFVVSENLRNIIKKNTHSSVAIALETYNEKTYINIRNRLNHIVLNLIAEFIKFQSTWSFSYNSWASSYKSQRANKDLLIRGETHMQFEFQILFPSYDSLSKDIENLKKRICTVVDFELPSILDEIQESLTNSNRFKDFMYKLFGKNPNIKYNFFNKEKK